MLYSNYREIKSLPKYINNEYYRNSSNTKDAPLYTFSLGSAGSRSVWLESCLSDNGAWRWQFEFRDKGILPDVPIIYKRFNKSKTLQDTTSTTGGSCIVNEYFKSVCEDNGISGLFFHPIQIIDQHLLTNTSQYYIMRATTYGPEFDKSKARYISNSVNEKFITKVGLTVAWPEQEVDIFVPEGTSYLVINSRFREVLLNASPSISGVRLTPLSAMEVY